MQQAPRSTGSDWHSQWWDSSASPNYQNWGSSSAGQEVSTWQDSTWGTRTAWEDLPSWWGSFDAQLCKVESTEEVSQTSNWWSATCEYTAERRESYTEASRTTVDASRTYATASPGSSPRQRTYDSGCYGSQSSIDQMTLEDRSPLMPVHVRSEPDRAASSSDAAHSYDQPGSSSARPRGVTLGIVGKGTIASKWDRMDRAAHKPGGDPMPAGLKSRVTFAQSNQQAAPPKSKGSQPTGGILKPPSRSKSLPPPAKAKAVAQVDPNAEHPPRIGELRCENNVMFVYKKVDGKKEWVRQGAPAGPQQAAAAAPATTPAATPAVAPPAIQATPGTILVDARHPMHVVSEPEAPDTEPADVNMALPAPVAAAAEAVQAAVASPTAATVVAASTAVALASDVSITDAFEHHGPIGQHESYLVPVLMLTFVCTLLLAIIVAIGVLYWRERSSRLKAEAAYRLPGPRRTIYLARTSRMAHVYRHCNSIRLTDVEELDVPATLARLLPMCDTCSPINKVMTSVQRKRNKVMSKSSSSGLDDSEEATSVSVSSRSESIAFSGF